MVQTETVLNRERMSHRCSIWQRFVQLIWLGKQNVLFSKYAAGLKAFLCGILNQNQLFPPPFAEIRWMMPNSPTSPTPVVCVKWVSKGGGLITVPTIVSSIRENPAWQSHRLTGWLLATNRLPLRKHVCVRVRVLIQSKLSAYFHFPNRPVGSRPPYSLV